MSTLSSLLSVPSFLAPPAVQISPPSSLAIPSPFIFPVKKITTAARLAATRAAGKRYKGTAVREEKLTEMIEKKVAEAMEACDGDEAKGSDGCRVAWDEVEEVSQAKADLRRKLAESGSDPLESFCEENPETDECRVYED